MNEQGFYTSGSDELLFSDTSVAFPDGTCLVAELSATYQYPYNGWSWFNSIAEASASLLAVPGIPSIPDITDIPLDNSTVSVPFDVTCPVCASTLTIDNGIAYLSGSGVSGGGELM